MDRTSLLWPTPYEQRYTNGAIFAPVAVAHKQHPKRAAQAEKDKAVLILRMVRIANQLGPFINEDRLGLIEADAVLFRVCRCLPFIPLEVKSAHA